MTSTWNSIVCYCILIALCASVCAVPLYPQGRDSSDGYLPRMVVPNHYNLEITTDIYQPQPPFPFSGFVEIFVTATVQTTVIILNSLNLNMVNIRVYGDPSNVVRPPSPILLQWELDANANFLILDVANPLEIGYKYIIEIYFNGVMNSGGTGANSAEYGLHWRSYVDDDGSTKYLAITQFQGIAARQMFPCFDEVDMKATFNVTVVSKPPSVTLSNMPLLRTEDRNNGWVANVFDQSPIMSTYQVTIAVGDFIYVEADWQNVTTYPVRIYARRQMANKLDFAAYVAPRIQAWFETETGIPYGLPKMDHIAIPQQTWAMENWGLITYSENILCVDKEVTGATGIEGSVTIIAHEIAHQWYGNLVTFKVWDDTWLNEGFATYFSYYPLEALNWPTSEFHQWDRILAFLDVDQSNTSVPIRKHPNTIWESDSMSAGSTYPKGSAVLRQIRAILTPAVLKRGLTRYLTKYAYDSVTTENLWEELNAQAAEDGIKNPDGSDINLSVHMDAWLNQFGYPVLNVTRNGDGTAAVTSRQYFNPVGQVANTPSPYNYSWSIPITIGSRTTSDWEMTPSFWIPYGASETILTGISTTPGDWFLINVNQLSFYRVDYDRTLRQEIIQQFNINHQVIPVESRAQFIDDSFAFSRTMYLPIALAMDTTTYLGTEHSYNPWSVALKHLRYFDRILQSTMMYSKYRAYLVNQLLPIYDLMGWNYVDMESPLQQMLRRDVIINICYYGYADCLTQAQQQYAAYKANPDVNSINANNLPSVLCAGIANGDGSDWSIIFDQYQKRRSSPFNEERYSYLFALACSTDTVWLDRLLYYIINSDLIDTRDKNQALYYLIQSRVGLPIVWNYFDNSWNNIPSSINKLARLRNIVSTFRYTSDSSTFNNFVGKYPPATNTELESYREMDILVLQNVDWLTTNEGDLSSWLDGILPKSSTVTMVDLKSLLPISPAAHWDSFVPPSDA